MASGRLRAVLPRAHGPAVFDRTGPLLATGGADGAVHLWDTASGVEHETIAGLGAPVAFDSARSFLVAKNYNEIRLYDLDRRRDRAIIAGHLPYDDTLVWDSYKPTQGQISAVVDPGGRILATAGFEGSIRLWGTESGRELGTINVHEEISAASGDIWGLGIDPSGTILVGHLDGSVQIWDIASRRRRTEFFAGADKIESVSFDSAGQNIALAHGGKVDLWEIPAGRRKGTLVDQSAGGRSSGLVSADFAGSADTLVTRSASRALQFWDATSRVQKAELRPLTASVRMVAVSPSGDIVASAGPDCLIHLWRMSTGEKTAELQGHPGGIISLTFGDPTMFGTAAPPLVSADEMGNVRIWDTASRRSISAPINSEDNLQVLTVHPSGTVVARDRASRRMELWNIRPGGGTIVEIPSDSWHAVVDPAGQVLAIGEFGITLYHVPSGRELRKLTTSGRRVMAFSPSGEILAVGGDNGEIELWHTVSGRRKGALAGHRGVTALAFDPTGREIVIGERDGSISWRDLGGLHRRVGVGLPRNVGEVSSIAFDPTGTVVVSGGEDGSVRIWDARTGNPIGTLLAGSGGAWAVLLPEGAYKMSGNMTDRFWWTAKLRRFDVGEVDPYLPTIRRVPAGTPLPL